MLMFGDVFPDFRLRAAISTDEDGAFIDIGRDSAPGRWTVLFFWPIDFSFVCPAEMPELSRLRDAFEQRGAMLYCVGSETEIVYRAWRRLHADMRDFPFPLLADIDGRLARALDIVDGQEGAVLRATYIVDPQKVVRFASVNGLWQCRDPSRTLRVLDTLQADDRRRLRPRQRRAKLRVA